MALSTNMLSRIVGVLVAATYGLIVFGAAVRVHGAGLACPDWPLCFGEVIPPIDFQVFMEFGHRVLAGSISLVFLGVLVATVRRRASVGRLPVGLAVVAAVVLVIQVILGGLTVLELLAEWTVTSHLLSGNTFCMLLMLLGFSLAEADQPVDRSAVGWGSRAVALGLALVVPAQLALGGLVASSYAGLACGTWPTCDGTTWFPTFEGLVGLQLMHRLMAYALVVAAGAAAVMARGRAATPARLVFLFVMVQAGIGIANVLMRMPVEVTLAHSAGAAAVWLSTAWLNWEAWRSPVAAAAPTGSGELTPHDRVALEGA